MSGPISDNGAKNAIAAAENSIGRVPTALSIGLTVLAGGTALYMARDSYLGSRDRVNQRVAELKEENDLEYSKFGWGHWSGKPWLDGLSHKLFGFKEYGPWGLRENMQELGIRISSIWSDVVLPNLLWFGLGIAGLYGSLGAKRVHAPFRAFFNWCRKTSLPPAFKREVKNFTGRIFKGLGRGIVKAATWPFLSLSRLGIASGIVLGIAFFLKQFNDAYGHDGQRDFFRNEIFDKHGVD
jgi:hypothetical protein